MAMNPQKPYSAATAVNPHRPDTAVTAKIRLNAMCDFTVLLHIYQNVTLLVFCRWCDVDVFRDRET